MSRRVLLEVVCDRCGVRQTWESHNLETLTATVNPGEMPEQQGWSIEPVFGAGFRHSDLCPACTRPKQKRDPA